MSKSPPIGVLGGTGLYEIPGLELLESVRIETPFGDPSSEYVRGVLAGKEVIFLSRHGQGHRVAAPYINFRANIFGFKALGVAALVAVNAVGSMKEEYHPTDIVVPDQFYDATKRRDMSFFTGTPAVHVDMADPTCPVLDEILFESGKTAGARMHRGGTYICIEGPAFSTRAESRIYKSWDVDVIGMTMASEARLAREAEICYSSLALVTDYDVWKEGAEDVSVEVILGNLRKNAETARNILVEAIPRIAPERECSCGCAMESAIVSEPGVVPRETVEELAVLIKEYLE